MFCELTVAISNIDMNVNTGTSTSTSTDCCNTRESVLLKMGAFYTRLHPASSSNFPLIDHGDGSDEQTLANVSSTYQVNETAPNESQINHHKQLAGQVSTGSTAAAVAETLIGICLTVLTANQ